jgi:acyl-CoA thioester hydrolase
MIDLESLGDDPRVSWTEDVLRYADMDPNGHINNATFSVLCESGRVHFFRTRLHPTLPPGAFFVIVRLGIEFRAEMHYPGRVRTGTWLRKLGRTSMTLAQVITSDGKLVATADGVVVMMERATRRPLPYADATRQVLESLLRASEG